MVSGYLHVEIETHQYSKKPGKPCGDVVEFIRDENSTIVIISDGLGSGIKANIAANMCIARLKELIRGGFSLRHSFYNVVNTMEETKTKGIPYAVFTILKILNDGNATVLSYEMPPPLILSQRSSNILQQRISTVNNSIIGASSCNLRIGEGILLMSDGLINAGMGKSLKTGWGIEGVNEYIANMLSSGVNFSEIPEKLNFEAKRLWENNLYDDCSTVVAHCIKGRIINLLTGPPYDKSKDNEVVSKFLQNEGLKIVCGGTTAKIVANYLNKKLKLNETVEDEMTPPDYYIEGIDLVTEGAITLNQLYNIWGEDDSKLEKDNVVTDLYILLNAVNRVNIFLGAAENPSAESIRYTQQGILKREKIVPLIADKLKQAGKLVTIEYY